MATTARSRLVALAALACLAGCTASRFLSYRSNPDPPPLSGQASLAGLAGQVEVYFDAHAVPHVEAASERDLAFAVGWLHGRERRFQMEMSRRLAEGRLAELFGNHPSDPSLPFRDTLATDRFFRALGLHRAAARKLASLPPESRALVEAYAAGVNEAARTLRPPIELRLLGVDPAPWEPIDTLAVANLQAWGLTLNSQHELLRYLIRAARGREFQEETFPAFQHPGPVIVEEGGRIPAAPPAGHGPVPAEEEGGWVAAVEGALGLLAEVRASARWVMPVDASNNWVLGPSRTASGQAMLANDPHLAHAAPGVFYLVHLRAPGVDVAGATMPGLPSVVLGHNRHIAWGATTTFADCQDVYLERLDPADPGRYLVPGGSEAFVVVDEPIRERRGTGFVVHPFAVRVTRHGPVLNDGLDEVLGREAHLLAMRSNLEAPPMDEIGAMARVARAASVADFRDAMRAWGLPLQNWVVADDGGHIGYFPYGLVPRRRGWAGTFPVPGWTGDREWDGFVPYDELPQLVDPPSGRIVTANNHVVNEGAWPWSFSPDAMPSYRAARILDVLDSRSDWTAADMARLQTDARVLQADRLLPALLAALGGQALGEREAAAFDALRSWDRVASLDSAGASVFFMTYRAAWEAALRDDLPRAAFQVLEVFDFAYGFFDRLWAEVPGAAAWDDRNTPVVEGRDDVLRAAFREAVRRLAGRFGEDVSAWRWERLHTITFRHPMGGNGAAARLFDVGPRPIPGARDTVFAAGGPLKDEAAGFSVNHGPAFRHVHDFGRPRDGGMVLDLGQSGWPGTTAYDNAFDDWRAGRLWDVEMDPERYRPGAVGRWVLRPLPDTTGTDVTSSDAAPARPRVRAPRSSTPRAASAARWTRGARAAAPSARPRPRSGPRGA